MAVENSSKAKISILDLEIGTGKKMQIFLFSEFFEDERQTPHGYLC